MLKTFFRLLGWTLVLAIAVAGLYLLSIRLDLPESAVAAGAALITALALGIVLVRRIFVRRRRRLQVQTIVTLDSPGIPDAPSSRLIDNRWNRAVSIMRKSYLGRRGNPLYALPWYMVMGRTGAGKSSSIAHSGLNAMQTDVGPDDVEKSTRNCDWHFFREAVVMDTAGRYAVPLNEAEDGAEWREFLARLARYRRKEPLNGLVIAVAADTLHGEGEHLLPEARCLRRRIDEIMRILGAKFPVYLMVTKIDLPAGMAHFLEGLPEDSKKQCMGVLVQSPEKRNLLPVDAQISNALRTLADRLRNFCLFAESPSIDDVPSPHRIFAWEELRAMLPALGAYANELFAANPYQETPLLRGIFLSSAMRGQQENSRAFPALSDLGRRVFRIRETAGGVFLQDFFGRVLPVDRPLHRPIAEYLRWRSSVRTVAYGAMLLATFGLGALFCLSYQRNAGLLDRMDLPRTTLADAGMTRRLLNFEQRFRDEAQLEKEVGSGFLPSMGFEQAKAAYRAYADALNDSFYRDVLNAALPALDEKRSRLTADTDDREFFILISDIIWRYDVLAAVNQGKSFEEILKIPAMPQGILQALGLGDAPQLGPSAAYSVARSMYSLRDPAERGQLLRTMRATLAQLPETKSQSLHWIVQRAGMLSTLATVRGEAFWPGSRGGSLHDVTLDPVYTKDGMAVTLDYLDNLNLILADDALKPSTEEFLRWYATNYQIAWQRFALDFADKASELATLPARSEAVSLMGTDNNPYFALLIRMDEELQAVRRYCNPPPAWMDDLAVLAQSLRELARLDPEKEKSSIVQRLKTGAQDISGDLIDAADAEARERDMKARLLAKDIRTYLDSLRDLIRFTMGNDLAFNAVKDAMPNENNPRAAQAPLSLTVAAAHAMNAGLNPNAAQDSPVYALVTGPLDFFMRRLMNGASCQIQAMWEGNVLAKAGRLAPSQLEQALFAEKGGIVRDYADNTLEFFLNRTLTGYEPETLAGRSMPFETKFLAFLNSGTSGYKPVRDEYGVTIAALPAEVNDGAADTPYAVELSLSCSRKKQELVNYNSPASTRFTWRQDTCGDTNLSIRFKTLTLDVLYAGENGFINFLNDFQFGTKTFKARDFPDQEAMLGKLGVSDIVLGYRISGAEDLLSGHRFAPGELPFVAAECKR
ncbi:MAG: hypothetical protein LBU06_07600 [Desulfovibrio sp.]|nr:hypothetical protein [Desulfovibrio sp.]